MKHHAYLLRTEQPHKSAVVSIVASLEISEVYYFEYAAFGIDDAKSLIKKAFQKPQQGTEQLLVVLTNTITVEAEQALLKLFEEPPQGTCILFCIPPQRRLLPTLLSRFSTLDSPASLPPDQTLLSDFMAMSLGDQIELIAKRLKAEDTVWISAMQAAIGHYIQEHRDLPHTNRATIHQALSRLNTRGASNKMLLEEIALSLHRTSK